MLYKKNLLNLPFLWSRWQKEAPLWLLHPRGGGRILWGKRTFLKRPFWVFRQLISPANRTWAPSPLLQNKLPPSSSFGSLISALFTWLSQTFFKASVVDKDDLTSFWGRGAFFYLCKFCSEKGRSNNMTLFKEDISVAFVWIPDWALQRHTSQVSTRVQDWPFGSEFVTPNKCSKKDCLNGQACTSLVRKDPSTVQQLKIILQTIKRYDMRQFEKSYEDETKGKCLLLIIFIISADIFCSPSVESTFLDCHASPRIYSKVT